MPPASECFALSPPLLQVRFAIAQPTVRIAPTKFLREKGNCTMPKLPDCDREALLQADR
ncbi:hypothetical protein [Nodularia sphaerocarpa]|uniref:hypothetical protein n=1 Tax=Nodularia sphaerocarpa TaxID=137816 RepID=UPI001EFACA62|nr:hypothetical protein [Nodularia sphaerocarpa]MDB9372677.1 hypothetical protein [Nodularia sphaerocarpa CS-585]MDB9378975.1 hypothetical protein [Nodularia sphaerocarpa CS-585A2]